MLNKLIETFLLEQENKHTAAIKIRTEIKAIGPNASTLARIKINELPQIAARISNKKASNNFNVVCLN